MKFAFSLAGAAMLFGQVINAHPEHDLSEEIAERRAFVSSVERASLEHCAEKLRARGVEERNVRRRAEMMNQIRTKRQIKKRSVDDVLATDHNKTELGYTPNTDADTIFGTKNSCVLTPEVTQGPYYVSGESIRRNIIEDQEGVNTVLDYQVINVDTCEPVPNVYLEIWHCNSTGVYSGVVAGGNGDSSDESNINNNFLRGIQRTDDDGVAQFETVFPGHYTGRATHIHIMAHTNATLYENKTLGNEIYASHVGQAFFDQTLISEVETVRPYSDNSQDMTLNSEDSILSEEAAIDGVDPLMEYALHGDAISDGIFAWLSFGVNITQSSSISPATFRYESGSVANGNSGMGGPGGGGGGPGGDRPGVGQNGTDDANNSSSSVQKPSYGLLMFTQLLGLCLALGTTLAFVRML